MSQSTQNRWSFRRCSLQPISWLSTEETKPSTTKANNQRTKRQKHIKSKPKPAVKCKNCSCVCLSLCIIVVDNTAQNSSDNLPSYPPDNHHSSDVVYWRGEWSASLINRLNKKYMKLINIAHNIVLIELWLYVPLDTK